MGYHTSFKGRVSKYLSSIGIPYSTTNLLSENKSRLIIQTSLTECNCTVNLCKLITNAAVCQLLYNQLLVSNKIYRVIKVQALTGKEKVLTSSV